MLLCYDDKIKEESECLTINQNVKAEAEIQRAKLTFIYIYDVARFAVNDEICDNIGKSKRRRTGEPS